MGAEESNRQNRQSLVKINAREIVKDIPFIILILNGISILIMSFAEPIDYIQEECVVNAQYVKHMNDYGFIYWLWDEIIGFGMFMVIFMAFYAYLHRYCLYSWVCIIGLGLLNSLNILAFFVNFGQYQQIYAGLIILPCLIFAIIYAIRQPSKNRN